jgi:radical SAM superfamily enzyme YgiQ (UPF0313 family)
MQTPFSSIKIKIQNKPFHIALIQVSSPDHYSLWNALSVETLAGHIRGVFKDMIEVQVFRVQSSSDFTKTISSIKRFKPRIIGISPELGSLKWTEKLMDRIQQILVHPSEKPLIVFGNKLPTYFPEYFCTEYPHSIVVVGEGEESLCGIINHVMGRGKLAEIPNLVYKEKNRKIHRTDERSPDLSSLTNSPSTDTIITPLTTRSSVLVQTSRGCSWSKCVYCTISRFRKGKKWESLPINRVLSNIEAVLKTGVSEIEFADDDFLGGRDDVHIERAYRLANGIASLCRTLNRRIAFRIFLMPHEVFIRGETSRNNRIKKLLLRLKQVGLARVYFGIESGCQSQLDRYNRFHLSRNANRKPTLEDIGEAIRIVRNDLRLKSDVGFIMFDPFLTLEEMIQNISFFSKWRLIDSNQWPFRPIAVNAETILYHQLKKHDSTTKETTLLSDLDLELMCYEYRFIDPRVQRIHDYIEKVSAPTRNIFYALKSITKQQLQSKDSVALAADRLVKKNGRIYLKLMRDLANTLSVNSAINCQVFLEKTAKNIQKLVDELEITIKNGSFEPFGRPLMMDIREWRRRDAAR